MLKLKLAIATGALALAMAAPVAAESAVSPWETFCLITQNPGAETGACVDGVPLPSAKTGGLVAAGGQDKEAETGREPATLELRQTPGAAKR